MDDYRRWVTVLLADLSDHRDDSPGGLGRIGISNEYARARLESAPVDTFDCAVPFCDVTLRVTLHLPPDVQSAPPDVAVHDLALLQRPALQQLSAGALWDPAEPAVSVRRILACVRDEAVRMELERCARAVSDQRLAFELETVSDVPGFQLRVHDGAVSLSLPLRSGTGVPLRLLLSFSVAGPGLEGIIGGPRLVMPAGSMRRLPPIGLPEWRPMGDSLVDYLSRAERAVDEACRLRSGRRSLVTALMRRLGSPAECPNSGAVDAVTFVHTDKTTAAVVTVDIPLDYPRSRPTVRLASLVHHEAKTGRPFTQRFTQYPFRPDMTVEAVADALHRCVRDCLPEFRRRCEKMATVHS